MTWWRSPETRPDVAAIVSQIALDRMRVIVPIAMACIVVAHTISGPAGIHVPLGVTIVDISVLATASVMYIALRARRIPRRYAHAMSGLVWMLAPITTIASYLYTGAAPLTLVVMIEVSTAALQLDTMWTLASTIPVVAAAVPLALHAGGLAVYPLSLLGGWVIAMVMQIGLQRSMIRAETHRLDVEAGAAALAHELDERRRAEADNARLRDQFVHAQRMDAVGTLAAGLAHDMNNILGGILAYAEVLHVEATDATVKEDLARIRQEAERGAALTRSLLAFSRRGQYRRRPILLHSVLDDMTPLLSRTLGRSITITRTDGPPTIIDGDPAQLGQVLLNLCLNASDAMNGTGALAIATDEVEIADGQIEGLTAGRYAKLAITDAGSGMDLDTKRRAFEPFFTTKPIGKGTGLGLAMVFGAAQAHGGAIVCDTELGRGTTMTIYLPASEANPALPPSSPALGPREHALVLVVDDEPVMRDAAVRLLAGLGLSAVTASDGDEAVAIYKQRGHAISLVLLDMAMPKLPGPECYRELRKLGRTPVLLVSGYTDDATARQLLDAGAEGFLEKPYTAEQLGGEIDRILGRAPVA